MIRRPRAMQRFITCMQVRFDKDQKTSAVLYGISPVSPSLNTGPSPSRVVLPTRDRQERGRPATTFPASGQDEESFLESCHQSRHLGVTPVRMRGHSTSHCRNRRVRTCASHWRPDARRPCSLHQHAPGPFKPNYCAHGHRLPNLPKPVLRQSTSFGCRGTCD